MSNSEYILHQPSETQTQTEQPLSAANSTSSLRENVETAMSNYFKHLDGQPVSDVYQMVMSEIEAPLLEQVMKYVRNNQTKAAQLLGLNRGTLRKKLKQYGLL
jgi:Fis family transcriptional regulator